MPYAHTIEGNPHWLPLNPPRKAATTVGPFLVTTTAPPGAVLAEPSTSST